ncbi:MAG: FixH family protein [Ectothiorhodospira sp.]
MDPLILTLGLGVAAEVAAFCLLRRLARWSAPLAALMVLAGALTVGLPAAVLFWPGADLFALHLALYAITPYGLALVATRRGAPPEGAPRVHWAPALIVGFFVVVVLVNAVLVTAARQGVSGGWLLEWLPAPRSGAMPLASRFPGTAPEIERTRQALSPEHALELLSPPGERPEVQPGWLVPPRAGIPGVLEVQVTAPGGGPLRGAAVSGVFLRPADARLDRPVRLTEGAPGHYLGAVTLPAPGRWTLQLQVGQGDAVTRHSGMTTMVGGGG